jgi:hypothetical protein
VLKTVLLFEILKIMNDFCERMYGFAEKNKIQFEKNENYVGKINRKV